MRILLLCLLLPCVGAPAVKRIIHRIVEAKTWNDAQAYCRLHHTDLLTIRNPTENEEITDRGWIGLRRSYYPAAWVWSSGHRDGFRTWASDQPGTVQHCVSKEPGDTGWHSRYCHDRIPFYCMDEVVLVMERMPWEEALERCRNLTQHHPTVDNHRYDLASPHSNVYSQNVFQGGFEKVWIGLRFLGAQWLCLNDCPHYDDDHLAHCPHRCGTLEKIVNGTEIAGRSCDVGLFFLCQKI